jgi:hypothetical protein
LSGSRQPRTEEQWSAVRQHAVVLLESTNLLMIPRRRVAAKPFACEACHLANWYPHEVVPPLPADPPPPP